MTFHHGRHEMPGWRGYLPESMDRVARGRPGGRGGGRSGTGARRAAAVGALAVCALAGGAVVTHVRSAGPPDSGAGAVDDTGVAGRSSEWTREATSVLGALDLELRRTDEVRRRWDASSAARQTDAPPAAVAALVHRGAELAHHRETLLGAMTAIRLAPPAEVAPTSAWQELRVAQDMLRALASGRGPLGDPVEATVLRLAREEPASQAVVGDRRSTRAPRTSSPFVDTVVSTGGPRAGASRAVATRAVASRAAAAGTGAPEPAVVRPVPRADRDDQGPDTPDLAPAAAPGGVDTVDGEPRPAAADTVEEIAPPEPTASEPTASEPTASEPQPPSAQPSSAQPSSSPPSSSPPSSSPTSEDTAHRADATSMLTFERPPSDAADASDTSAADPAEDAESTVRMDEQIGHTEP